MLRKIFLYLLLHLLCTLLYAQDANYIFQRLSVKDGLFEETVHAVQQDERGFMWLNFRTLIQRYDGYRLINFYPGKELPERNVRAMQIDRKNRLWLLNGDATIGYLDPDNFKYHAVKLVVPKGFSHIITAMYVNRSNEIILIWDRQGFITYNEKTGIATAANNAFSLPQGWELLHIWQDESLNYWTGTTKGLIKYNASAKTTSYAGHNVDNDPAITAFEQIKSVNTFYIDRFKNYWLISWEGGLKILSLNSNNGRQIDWAQKINAVNHKYFVPLGFTETAGNDLWLTGSNLFCKLNTATETLQLIPQESSAEYSIIYDIIFSVYEDKEKNIWLGTNKGLFRFNPQAQLFKILSNKRPGNNENFSTEVSDFLETQDGELLVSTWGAGIFSYNQKLEPVSSKLINQNWMNIAMMWSMIQRKNGDLWVGMQNGALVIFQAANKQLIQLSPQTAEGKTIRTLAEDKNDNIWMGTQGGAVIKWDATTQTFTKQLQVDALVSRIYVDSSNQIWIGTDRDGLYCINSTNGKVLQHYTSAAPLNRKLLINGVSDILQYNDSVMYFGGNGLSILNTKTNLFQYFTVANGLPSANISNFLKDKNGFIWMTSGSGILSYHPEKKRLSHYGAKDGVPNFSFNAGAASVLQNGNIVFGTNKDFLLFNPDDLTSRTYPAPKVHIAGLEVMGRPKNLDSLSRLPMIRLNPGQNSFRVLVSTLKYKDDFPVYYMLEGIDKTWTKAEKTNTISYNYLPPGKYILKTCCFHEDGTPGEVTSLSFYIAAPFYRQWWFYALLALTAGALLFWMDIERLKRREKEDKMRSSIAGNLHQEVNTTLQNINVLSEIAKIKADKDIVKSKEFIEQINGMSKNMITVMDDMLWSIDPANDSMDKTILRMQEFIDTLVNSYGVKIAMHVDEKIKDLKLNMQLRHDSFLLFRESIRKLVDAGVKDCTVHLAYQKNNILFTIECNDSVLNLPQLNKWLQNTGIEHRINTLRGSIKMEEYNGHSTLITKLPV